MKDLKELKVNIGAGQTYITGFINIDISNKADISLDLGKNRLPFDDNSVDLVFSYHTLEHVSDYLFALSEIYRVLKHGGRFLVGLPYVTLTEYHLVNPYHIHNFNEFSFDFFDIDKLKDSAAEKNPIYFIKVFHRFHYIGLFNIMPPPVRSLCRRHLFNVVRKIDFGLIAVKRSDEAISSSDKQKLLKELKGCLNGRTSYEQTKTTGGQKGIHRLIVQTRSWWSGNGL